MNVAFTALHTGRDYLAYAIHSVAPYVDRWIFAYSEHPSHGHGTDAPCPENELELKDVAHYALAQHNTPYTWYNGEWSTEGDQRDMIYNLSPSAEIVLVVDADEVWQGDAPARAIAQARATLKTHKLRVPFLHFWRSFDHVCRDAAQPVRVLDMLARQESEHEGYIDCAPVLHFGYARKPEDIYYKMQIHGHKAEWRDEWYTQTFIPWTPDGGPHTDLHPTCHDNFWHTETFDKETMPDIMKRHPYYNMAVIK